MDKALKHYTDELIIYNNLKLSKFNERYILVFILFVIKYKNFLTKNSVWIILDNCMRNLIILK